MGLRISSKLYEMKPGMLTHWCPGCEGYHAIHTREANAQGARWVWNGEGVRPTFTPSINVGPGWCHYFLRDGMIQFLLDCHHDLKGQTVPLPDNPASERAEERAFLNQLYDLK